MVDERDGGLGSDFARGLLDDLLLLGAFANPYRKETKLVGTLLITTQLFPS